MKKFNERKLSDNELSYLYFENLAKPFFSFFIEYSCSSPDKIKKDIKKSINKTMIDFSELNSKVKNKKYIYYKNDISLLNIICDFDGYDFSSICKHLSDDKYNSVQLYNVNDKYLVFRFNHAYIDGKGAILFINNFLSHLLNQKIDVYTNSYISDIDFIKDLPKVKHKRNLSYKNILKYKSSTKEDNVYYQRISLNKKIPFVLSKIIKIMNNYFKNDKLTYLIPTNIGILKPEVVTISNLTVPLYLNLDNNEDWFHISKNIYNKISKNDNLNIKNIDYGLLLKLPSIFYKSLTKISVFIETKFNRFLTSGSITNLLFNYNKYNTNRFTIKSIFLIPFYQPLLPFVISIVESEQNIEVVFCSNEKFIDKKTCQLIVKDIKNIL